MLQNLAYDCGKYTDLYGLGGTGYMSDRELSEEEVKGFKNRAGMKFSY